MSDKRPSRPALIDFEGRVARVPFALAALGIGVAMPWMIELAILCARNLGAALPAGEIPSALRGFPASLALPALIVDGLAILASVAILLSFEVRRLHDMNLTGWAVFASLAFYALPLPDLTPFPSIAFVMWSVLLAVVPGTRGSNAYGSLQTS